MSAGRKALFALIALSMMGVFSLVFLEVGVRLLAPQKPSWLAIQAESPDFPFFVHQPNLDKVVDVGETEYRILTNDRGRRIGEVMDPKPGARRVLAVGDSFTFGNAVNYEDSFVGMLNADPGYDVINLGIGGYGPEQYLAVLRHELDHGPRPDVVLISTFAGNDVHDCIWNKDLAVLDGVAGGHDGSIKDVVKRHSHLYRLASNIYHAYFSPVNDPGPLESLSDPRAWEAPEMKEALVQYKVAFEELVNLLNSRKIPYAVALIPMRETVIAVRSGAPPQDGKDFEFVNRQMLTALRGLGVNVIDPTAELAKHDVNDTYFAFDGHFTREGHRLYLDLVRPALVRGGKPLLEP